MNLDFSEKCRIETKVSESGIHLEFVVFNSGGALVQIFDNGCKFAHVTVSKEQLKQMVQ